jgi:glycosyltransferase involved in cell wall biosynthesis
MIVGDAQRPTGFERVVRAIGDALHATGRYTVIVRGVGFNPDKPGTVPPYQYEVKQAGPTTGGDPHGSKFLPDWIEEDKPDVILFVEDLWNQTKIMRHFPEHTGIKTMGYYPVDSPNMKSNYAVTVAALDDAIPYTAFGARETAAGLQDAINLWLDGPLAGMDDTILNLRIPQEGQELRVRMDRVAALQNPEAFAPIPHGIDPDAFTPVPKNLARKMWGVPESTFVVQSVNTNQFRKRQDITIRAFAWMAQHHPDSMLLLHCSNGDAYGWDLAQLSRLYGVQDKVMCIHWVLPELDHEQLQSLYSLADVHINTGGGEGWGLTSVESALCGVAQLVPDWSATKEIWEGHGMLLPLENYRFEPKYINTAHACVDPLQAGKRLLYLAQNQQVTQGLADACQKRARELPTWAQVGQMFVDRVDAVLAQPPATGLTPAELKAARKAVVRPQLPDLL